MKGFIFEVRPFNKNYGVYSYNNDPEDGRFDIVFDTFDRAVATRDLLDHWYNKGRFDERHANTDDSKGTG